MGTDSYVANLKETIKKTGFPLELEIDDILREEKWYTFPNHHYVDDEENTQREIDNLALYPEDGKHHAVLEPLGVSPHLLVECKKLNGVSAVILCRKMRVVTNHDYRGQMYDFPWLIERRPRSAKPWQDFDLGWFLDNTKFHYKSFADRIGIGVGIKPGDEHGKSGIIFRSGIMQLVKAQSYDVRISIDRDKTIVNPYYPFYFTILALVVEGRIFEVERKGSDLDMKEVEHAMVRTSYKPKYSEEIMNYLIDVVHKNYFRKYLNIVLSDFSNLVEATKRSKESVVQYMERKSPATQPRGVL